MSESIEYVTDEHANRKAVIIPYPEWQKILEAMEELDDIRAYDRAKADSDDEEVPFDQAIAEIKN
ncbi:hypothetical protein [uncultured Thiohalocapsa sp.]|uniref:hypothetical protein n=1 Tax=uncultured Thiohalocapsa sp. TaxID=768990 RepID=UPI0025D04829|nr:hypothetical protein [uncultured Thiohalocapsa sp.]